MPLLITGHSRGLGAALTRRALARGEIVYGVSRSALGTGQSALHELACDLSKLAAIAPALSRFVPADVALDEVWLNAGVLGRIANLRELAQEEINTVMDINVWANKAVIDWLAARAHAPKRVVLISSGAGVVGNHGWGAYALSKAALNMLAQLYAHELPATQLLALAPGLIDTDMQSALREVDIMRFPALKRLHAAHGSADMPDADTVAARIEAAMPRLSALASGSFIDLRKL
ncbi:MAG: SDR family NAD(P)-dependent oxidoreductase [Gammaproteobacteria bacterium]|nr:SDR family NAD(P)-dependent oxidoreductase [Gammaproteobacteria bacterium]